MAGKKKILLIGPMPPPSGGVSVHLNRLLKQSANHPLLNMAVLDLKKFKIFKSDGSVGNLFSAFIFFLSAEIIHIHLSHSIKIFIAGLCRLFGKKVFYTQHNPRELLLKSTQSVIKLSAKTIFVFDSVKLPKNGIVIPAYIQSDDDRPLPYGLEDELNGYKNVIVSVRSDSSIETGKLDLYGFDLILDAAKNISFKENTVLVLVDSAGKNFNRFESEINEANKIQGLNILYINNDINFPALLSKSNIFIRASRSDGDSLSVREALNAGVHVIASDCSIRPDGCRLFHSGDAKNLSLLLEDVLKESNSSSYKQEDFKEKIFELYNSF